MKKKRGSDKFLRTVAAIFAIMSVFLLAFTAISVHKSLPQKDAVHVEDARSTELKSEKITEGAEKPVPTAAEESATTEPENTAPANTKQVDGCPPEPEATPKTIYMTFDDGPSENTDGILNILREHGVLATFFVVGKTDNASISSMQRIVAEGHALAPHSFSHNFKEIYASEDNFFRDLDKISELVESISGEKSTFFRFAGGSNNNFIKRRGISNGVFAELKNRGMHFFDWNVSSEDSRSARVVPKSEIVKRVVDEACRCSCSQAVVLMHDCKCRTTTVQALPEIFERLKAQGCNFAKLTADVDPAPFSLVRPYPCG